MLILNDFILSPTKSKTLSEQSFEFNPEEMVVILQFIIQKKVDPKVFIKHCEQLKGELCVRSKREGLGLFKGLENKRLAIFTELDKKVEEVIDILFFKFIYRKGDEGIKESRELIEQMKNLLQSANTFLSSSYKLTTVAFLEFLQTEKALIFQRVTAARYYGEEN